MLFTTTTLIAFAAGLLVGWNFLTQPAFVKALIDKLVIKIKAKICK
jgi:hypothetical protein